MRYIRTDKLLASDAQYAKTWYHYASDELGSITHVVDETGDILNHYEYDAWGNLTTCKEQIENRFKFTGQQLDPVSQQYYLRARFYNPVIRRFTQEDTYYEDGLNLYAYCRNNPVYYVDPSGNICTPAAQRMIDKLDNNQATKNEQRKLAAYLRNKLRKEGPLQGAEARAAERLGIEADNYILFHLHIEMLYRDQGEQDLMVDGYSLIMGYNGNGQLRICQDMDIILI